MVLSGVCNNSLTRDRFIYLYLCRPPRHLCFISAIITRLFLNLVSVSDISWAAAKCLGCLSRRKSKIQMRRTLCLHSASRPTVIPGKKIQSHQWEIVEKVDNMTLDDEDNDDRFFQECDNPRVCLHGSRTSDPASDAKHRGHGCGSQGARHGGLLHLWPGTGREHRHGEDQEVPDDPDQLQRGNLCFCRSRSQEECDQSSGGKHFGSRVPPTASTNYHISRQTVCSSFSPVECSQA